MNTFGRLFRISIFGESHGKSVGVTIDGCPSGINLSLEDFLPDLARRKSGGVGTTPRIEKDLPIILSGVFNNITTGAPITLIFENQNTKSGDYLNLFDTPRPGHADFVASRKYKGFADYTGGGHFSGRITLGLVAAGVIAKKIINPIEIGSQILQLGGRTDFEQVVKEAVENHDSIGGLIELKAKNLPVGLGEPFFDSAEALLAHIIFSIPAIKGIEFGSGFNAAKMKGSEHNDTFIETNGKTLTNNAAGINGGITNGNDIVFRIAVKPTSSIGVSQHTMNMKKQEMENLLVEGRHDACIALRVPVVAEAATAIVLADLLLIQKGVHL